MLLGAKLDVGYARHDAYRQLFGSVEPLELLPELGFGAVETPVGWETDDAALWEHIERCHEAGLRVSLHPYSEGLPANAAWFTADAANPCRRFHERFFEAAVRVAELQGGTTVVNIHAAAAAEVPRAVQAVRSVEFFTWCRQWCDAQPRDVRVVVELQIAPNPDEMMLRIGDRYDELLEIARQSGVGIGWDFGHGVINHRRFGTGLWPSDEFLTRVAHIHCHDLNECDHQPLLFNTVPWQTYLARAVRAGFDGTVIVEVPPEHYLRHGGLAALRESAARLREVQEALAAGKP